MTGCPSPLPSPRKRGQGEGRRRRPAACAGIAALLLLTACEVGPDYRRPPVAIPAAYKEAAVREAAVKEARGWQRAKPADATERGPWWSVFGDPVLDGLERQVAISNQNLAAAAAAYRESVAIVAQARAGFFPTAQAAAVAQRSRAAGSGHIASFFSATGSASWAPDLWGKVRRTVEGNLASAQASAGDLANLRLAAQAQLATDYLQLRIADQLKRLLDAAVAAYRESLRIATNQYNAGIAAASDVAQAKTQVESTEAQAIATGILRAQYEHAIAVLIGEPPAALTIAPVTSVPPLPEIPAGLPAALLERRPDIAAAERRMAAANASIGVAETAFFPTITLSGESGTAAVTLAKLVSASSRIWSLGSDLAQTIFDAGARHAQVEQARAVYDAAVADYRQAVLSGLRQVEDALAALRLLASQQAAEDQAVAASKEAERIIENQYKAGTVAYTSVVVAQTAALANAETALGIRQSRLVATVSLIEALGGGWTLARLPAPATIERESPLNFSPFPPPDALPKLDLPKLEM